MLNVHYIRALEKKANRFLDKKSVQKEKQKIKTQFRDQALLCNITSNNLTSKSEQILSSDTYPDSNSQSPTRHGMSKGSQNKREVVIEGQGDDYYSDSYEDFGDVEDVGEMLTSDPDQRGSEAYPSSASSQKAPK